MKVKINEIILTVFFCGKSPKAPGTVASFVTILIWLFLTKIFCLLGIAVFFQSAFWLLLIAAAFYYSIKIIPDYLRSIGSEKEVDHRSITIDEFIGQIIALQLCFAINASHHYFAGNNAIILFHLAFSFAAFRYFDIKKPSFIGAADKQIKSPFGVIFDDVISGIVAGAFTTVLMVMF